MAITEYVTGTEAVSTTEHSMTTDTAGPDVDTTVGKFQAVLDLSDMIDTDVLQFRVYEKARSGDTQRVMQEFIFANAQADPNWISPEFTLMNGWDMTLDALAGTITVLWSIRRMDDATVTTYTGNTPQTGDAFARIGAAGAGLTAIDLPDQTMNITGNITGNLSGSVGSVTGAVGSVTGNVSGTIGGLTAAALKDFFDTDSATTYASAVAGSVVKEIADNAGGSSLTAGDIADAVWDEDATAHQTQGSFGQAIGDPGADTDTLWALANTNLDAAVSTRASQASVDTVDDFLDTEIAAIKAKTDNLPADPADASDVAALITLVDDFVDTEVAAIKAKTDQLTFTTANRVDSQVFGIQANAITAAATAADFGAEVADAVLDRDMSTGTDSGSTTVRTVRQALRFLRNKWAVSAGTLTVYKEDDSTSSWTSALTGTAGADPVTSSDPAGP